MKPSHYRAIAQYYDAEYDGSPMLQQDVPFFLSHLPGKQQRVLEIAVGTARAAIPIVQAGHRVLGVDYDKNMLEIAKFKRDAVGIDESQLKFVRQDALKMKVPGKFDWACIFFNTLLNFVTLAEQDQLLQRIRAHLSPRGRLWIDIFNPNLDLLNKPTIHQDPATFYVPSLDRSVYRDTELRPDATHQLQHVTFHYHWHDDEGTAKHERLKFDLTFIFPRELRMLLERNGYRLEKLYGDYDGSEVTDGSPRLIAIARKQE